MDKSTLSNYGWIVIAVLVLAVMIALATPFGTYIENGVRSTTAGLFETSEKALNVVGMSAGNGSFEGGSGTSTPTKDPALNPTGVDVIDGEYIYGDYKYIVIYPDNVNSFGALTLDEAREIAKKMLMEQSGMSWDEILAVLSQQGINTEEQVWEELELTEETFVPAIPNYRVSVLDKTKTEYGPILESINGEPITNMDSTFRECTSLTTAPVIPNSVTDMRWAFKGCPNLTTAPTIPNGVTNMDSTFKGCTNLTTAPVIPNSVTDMDFTFQDCTNLTTAPVIPNSVTSMRYTFAFCTNLTTAPEIPNSVTNMEYTFWACTSLTTAPTISNSVTNMEYTFSDCTNLTTAPTIPNSVTSMNATFRNCTNLTTAPEIPNSVTSMDSTFLGCTSLTGTITINANPKNYGACLRSTQITKIIGDCTIKDEILTTK